MAAASPGLGARCDGRWRRRGGGLGGDWSADAARYIPIDNRQSTFRKSSICSLQSSVSNLPSRRLSLAAGAGTAGGAAGSSPAPRPTPPPSPSPPPPPPPHNTL